MRGYFIVPLLLFSLLEISCEKNINNYIRENKASIFKVETSSDTIIADSKSTLIIKVTLSNDADRKDVNFITSSGKFIDSNTTFTTKAVEEKGKLIATAYLNSTLDTSSYNYIKISIPKIDTIIHFKAVTAFPETLNIESSTTNIANKFDSRVPFDCYLSRSVGIPSKNQKITLSAYTNTLAEIGEFINVDQGSNEKGVIKGVFLLKDTSYTGILKIVSSAIGIKGTKITDTLKIFITK